MGEISGRPGADIPFTKEQVQEALDAAWGNLSKAAASLRYPNGKQVPRPTFCYWVEKYELKYYSTVVKKQIAQMALQTVQKKAIKDEDNQCLFKLLDRWGKFIEFEDPKNEKEDEEEKLTPAQAMALARHIRKEDEKKKQQEETIVDNQD